MYRAIQPDIFHQWRHSSSRRQNGHLGNQERCGKVLRATLLGEWVDEFSGSNCVSAPDRDPVRHRIMTLALPYILKRYQTLTGSRMGSAFGADWGSNGAPIHIHGGQIALEPEQAPLVTRLPAAG